MEIVKIELPLSQEPKFFCPFSGYNLLSEEFSDAIEEEFIGLSVNWEDADDFVAGHLSEDYQAFEYDEEDGDPTDRVEAFIKSIGKEDECFIIELTINGLACGPVMDCNTYVFWK